ncbi:MAG: hypothetical protein ACRDI2_10035 [Chloroflexota bacterium]
MLPRDVPIRELQATLITQCAELRQSLGPPNWQAIEDVGQLPKHRPAPSGDDLANAELPRATVPAERWIR